MTCFRCDSAEDVNLYNVQFVAGSVGVLRPVCKTCIENWDKDEKRLEGE